MKRHLTLLILALVLLPATSYAQKGLKVGGYFLPQYSLLLNADDAQLDEDLYRNQLLQGMAGGLSFGYHFADIVGLRLNLLYSQEGGAYSARRTITERTLYTQRLQYLKIPLLLYLNSGTVDRKVIFAFAVGPQINFLSKAYAYNDNPAIDLPLPDNFSDFPSQKEIYTSFTYGIASEVGVDIQLPPDNFVLNLHLRGDYALSDAENKDASFRITDGGLTNRYNYWNYYRGISRDAETFPLNVGLQIGITYTFAQGE